MDGPQLLEGLLSVDAKEQPPLRRPPWSQSNGVASVPDDNSAIRRPSPTTLRLGQKPVHSFARPPRDSVTEARVGEQAKSAAKGAAQVAQVACVQREADVRLEVERLGCLEASAATMALLKTAAEQMQGADAGLRADAVAAQQAVALRGRAPLSEGSKYAFGVRVCPLQPLEC